MKNRFWYNLTDLKALKEVGESLEGRLLDIGIGKVQLIVYKRPKSPSQGFWTLGGKTDVFAYTRFLWLEARYYTLDPKFAQWRGASAGKPIYSSYRMVDSGRKADL